MHRQAGQQETVFPATFIDPVGKVPEVKHTKNCSVKLFHFKIINVHLLLILQMRPDYPYKVFSDKRVNYVLLVESLAIDRG
ncbi:hypothetical protein NIASO_06920 [Niabella soli DSM 19437]|uniref:Uncharacterized protein n=1 Tax=Niabella soli DSM 19437 TaxID=929713 RepID=W0F7S9_9BACT|nr:hypothetical protein NIASO_06920 [Niabella soli DSM 19437]